MDISIDSNGDLVEGPALEKHLGKHILKCLRMNGNKINKIDVATGAKETCFSVRSRSISVAQAIKAKDLKIGDVIMICAKNHIDASIPLIASMYIGIIPLHLAVGMKYSEIKQLTDISKPKIVFTDFDMLSVIEKVIIELDMDSDIVVFDTSEFHSHIPFADISKSTGTEESFTCEEFDPDTTTAFVVCSSGTTGLPKLVAVSHRAISTQFASTAYLIRKKTHLNIEIFAGGFLCFSSLFWISGIFRALECCIYGYTRYFSSKPFSPNLFKHAVENYKPSYLMISPSAIYELVKYPKNDAIDYTSIKSVYVGGSILNPDVVKKFMNLISTGIVVIIYGTTEVNNITLCPGFKRNSVGKMYPWIEWKVVKEDTEEKLGPNITGELRIKSVLMFQKYFNDAEATKNAFDSEGFFKTGDLLYYDEDDYFYFVDRSKEVIKYANFQVPSAELEIKICDLPEVMNAVVVGAPDPEKGELPMAFVKLVPGAKLTAEAIKDLIKNNLSDYKQLRGGVVFVENFPLTPSGKPNRREFNRLKLTMKGE